MNYSSSHPEYFHLVKSQIDLQAYLEEHLGHEISTRKRYRCPLCDSSDGFAFYAKNGTSKFKCHSCQAGGDAIDFEMLRHNVSRWEAMKIVAHNAGIILPGMEDGHKVSAARPVPKSKPKPPPEPPKTTWKEILNSAEIPDIRELTVWLERKDKPGRNYGIYTQRGAEIALQAGVRILNNTAGIIKGVVRGVILVFPTVDEIGQVVGCQITPIKDQVYRWLIQPKDKEKKKEWNLTWGKKWGAGSGNGVFPIDMGSALVFLVESVANALALACAGYSAVSLMGTSGVKAISLAKAMFPGKQAILWLDRGAENKQWAAMNEFNVEGIFWEEERPKGYDHNDLMSELQDQFPQAIVQFLNRFKITDSKTSPTKKISDSRSTEQGVFNLVVSPTSAGKTVFAAQSISEDIKANDTEDDTEDRPIASYLTDTKKNINETADLLLSHGISEEDFSIQISGVSTAAESDADEDEDDPDNEQGTEPIRKGNLGHYHWLGFKGNLPETFAVAGYTYEDRQGQERTRHGLTTALFLYLDEFHTIFDICTIEHDLCRVYLPKQLGKETWVFPTDQFQGPGTQFFFHWPVLWKYQKFDYKGMPKIAMDINTHYLKPKNLDFLGHTFEELQNPAIYKQIYKTLFVLDLPQATTPEDLPPRLSKEEKKTASEYDYLQVLYPYLYKPQIQIEFPIMRESGQPISLQQFQEMFHGLLAEELQKLENDEKYPGLSPDQKEDAKKNATKKARQRLNELIIKPVHAAYVPRLCGYNLLPFVQILRFSTSINAFSATMDDIQAEIVQYVCKVMDWKFQLTVVNQAPIRFPVKMLSLRQQIALPDLAELLLVLANNKMARGLVVSWKKVNVNRLWELLDKIRRKLKLPQAIMKEFCRFISGGYHTDFIDAYRPDSNLLTYDGAAILQGGNLPYHNLGVFDCGLWIRRAVLCIRCKELTAEEIDLLMKNRIVVRLTQMSGRLFRDEAINALRRQHQAEGKEAPIYQSNKTIVLLLHNHAEVLATFAPDPNLCASFVHYQENKDFRFFSKIAKHFVDSLAEAIGNCLAGAVPANWAERDAQTLAEKPRDQMHKAERKAIQCTDQKKLREQQKAADLEKKAKEAAKAGMVWYDFKRKNNLDRLQPNEKDRLHSLFKPGREPGEEDE